MRASRRPDVRRAAAALALTLAAGCVRSTEAVGEPRIVLGAGPGTRVVRNPDGTLTRDATLRITLDPLPPARTDGFALPVTSPDGTRLALQERSNADWPTLLADRGSTRALSAAVTVRGTTSEAGRTADGLLLGRMASAQGVLVECPREDGARWIGLLPWKEGEPTWLAQESGVQAFAALGPRGELALCRRPPERAEFDLVVSRPEGSLTWPRREGESWLMPVVATDGVYACSLRDGVLELAFLPLRAGDTLTTSEAAPALLRKRVSLRGTERMAFQSFAAVTPDRAATALGLLFFHPDLRRMAIWNPRTDTVTLLAERSVAALLRSDGTALVSLPDRLVLQEVPPVPGLAPLQLISGLWIARGFDAQGALLVGPRADGAQVSRLRTGQTAP